MNYSLHFLQPHCSRKSWVRAAQNYLLARSVILERSYRDASHQFTHGEITVGCYCQPDLPHCKSLRKKFLQVADSQANFINFQQFVDPPPIPSLKPNPISYRPHITSMVGHGRGAAGGPEVIATNNTTGWVH